MNKETKKKAGYPSNAHYLGTNNEKQLIQVFQKNSNYFGFETHYGSLMDVVKAGGTTGKVDILLCYENKEKKISAKNHKGGSHDWLNCSVHKFNECKAWIKKHRMKCEGVQSTEKNRKHPDSKRVIEEYRALYKAVCNKSLSTASSSTIRECLERTFLPQREQDLAVVLSDKKAGIDYLYEVKNHPIFKSLDNSSSEFTLSAPGGAIDSRKIYCDGIDTTLRIRLTTNNGMGAVLAGKAWSKARTASAVFKIQQDSPLKIINNLKKQGLVLEEAMCPIRQ